MASTPLRPLLLAAALLLGLLAAPARAERGIVGGEATTAAQTPWQVALVDTSHYGFPIQFCGGSILDARHVLTAAHCVDDPALARADEVYAGTTLLSDPQQIVPVADHAIHPGYGSYGSAGDVAVLTLAAPLELDGVAARPIELASEATAEGTALTVSGWGDMSNGDGLYPNQLRAVTVHAVGDESCAESYGAALVPAVMLCAGEPGGGRDSCAGDSGGPLVDTGADLLVGVVSFGNECALPGYPGVYTELAAASIRSFVEAELAEPSPPVVEPPPVQPTLPTLPTLPVQLPPAPLPAEPPPVAPGDAGAPVASVSAGSCTRRACTLLIRVRDPGVSAGIRGVRASVRSRLASLCRVGGGRATPCVRTTARRALRAVAIGPGRFRLRATQLPSGASNRFSLVATDNAGHRQARPTVVRLATRGRRQHR